MGCYTDIKSKQEEKKGEKTNIMEMAQGGMAQEKGERTTEPRERDSKQERSKKASVRHNVRLSRLTTMIGRERT
jgi:hypothetical protein